jgi:gas vesicle protein
MANTGKIIGALLAGFAVGAAAALLFAPYKGSTIRRRLSESTGRWADDSLHALEDLKEKIMQLTHFGNGHNDHGRLN